MITLRASRFARRRREEERADTLYRLRATTNKVALRARNARAERAIRQGIALRRMEEERGEVLLPLRATAAGSERDARAASHYEFVRL